MNKGLLTFFLCIFFFANYLVAQNPHGDLRIEMLDYWNLVIDHNIQSSAGASPESVYIGVQICNDGGNDMTDVFAYIGDHSANTPGIYPTYTAPSNRPYDGTFSFTHEGGEQDATRFIGELKAGECITQYWLLSYPLMDDNGVPLFGHNSKTWDDAKLTYDVWATAMDNGNFREAEDSKTVTLRAQLTANANKIWPNNTNQVPSQYLSAFPSKELGWHMTSNVTHPGATIALEGNWFKLGKVNKGFDNDGDYQRDYNFLIQPVGNPGTYDANCYRLVKVSGMMMIKLNNGTILEIPFEDRMHFANIPSNNTGGVGFVVYEFAVLEGNCTSDVSPYQEAASGKNREKFNADFGNGEEITSEAPSLSFEVDVPANAGPGDQIEVSISTENTTSVPLGSPEFGTELVFQQEIPEGTTYVSGSASSNNSLPSGTGVEILYSTDDGQTWETTEPSPAYLVRRVQWWLDRPFNPGQQAEVTFEVEIDPSFAGPSISFDPGLSTGSGNPFTEVVGTIAMQGGNSISGTVFLDNAAGNATLGDGVQTGTEPGVGGVAITLYQDMNGNGEVNDSDLQIDQVQTNSDGSFEFADLSSGDYLIEVDETDNDLPEGFVNTTLLVSVVEGLSVDTEISFGFAPLLEITNTLVSSDEAFESATVQYQVQLENLSYAEDIDNSSAVTAWASQLDPATNFNYYKNNLLGEPDVQLSWPNQWDNRVAKVKGFDFSDQEGEIEKVEIIISICLDYSVWNDYLEVSFLGENGQVYYAPDPVLSKNSTPSLNDYVGPPNIGLLILDITDYQDWDWDVFDSEWYVAMEGHQVGYDDGAHQYTDAIGVRVTSTCCASSGGEPGNVCATITETPMEFEYDASQLEFVSSSVSPDNVSNGVISFDNVGALYSNQISTIDFTFEALQPNGSPVTTTVTVTDGETGCGIGITDSDDSEPLTIVNLGSVTGFVFGDADGDGWKGVNGYESGVDNFIPNVEVNLFVCKDDWGNNIYPAPNKWKSCTHWQNDGHWELVKSDTTGEDGSYRLAGLNNGYYYLELDETTLTNSAEQTADPDYTNGIPSPSWKIDKRWKRPDYSLQNLGLVGIGNDHANVNFGYFVQSTIEGIVYEDTDGDGVKDNSEEPIPNVEVEFAHSGCTPGVNCPTRLTNGNGEFTYNSAIPDTEYTISIDVDNIQGADTWVITGEPDGTPDNSFTTSVSAGEQVFDLNIGVQPAGDLSLGGKVYYDWSGNAHRNSGDEGISGVEVKLYKDENGNGSIQPSDPQVATTVTDINGDYMFANKPSDSYIVQVQENDIPIFPKQTEDPDEYGVCTTCDAKTSVSEENYTATINDVWNYFNYANSGCEICDEGYTSTSDAVWANDNLDEIVFSDPIGNSSACVSQIAVTFRVAASDFEKDYYTSYVNNINYHYPIELNGVQIGTFNPVELPYWCGICEDVTLIYDVDFGSIPYNFNSNNTLDLNFYSYNESQPSNQQQDICVADIRLEFIGEGCAADYLNLDFGYQPTGDGVIEGCVFEDENNNAFENPDDPPIDDVEVSLEVDMNEDEEYHRIETTTTDDDGVFRFEDVPDGVFRVVVNPQDPDLPLDSNGDPVPPTTEETYRVDVVDGEVERVNNVPCSGDCDNEMPAFGFGTPGTVIGIVFKDENGNGNEDIYEEGIANVTVYICDAADGSCDATNAVDTVQTAEATIGLPAGYYLFTGLLPGTYTVAVDVSTVPSGYTLTADPSTDGVPCYEPLDVDDPNYAMLSVECDHMMKSFEIDYGSEYAGVDFGYQPTGVLGCMVWFDEDEDGEVDDDEEGLDEVEVSVRNTSTIIRDGIPYNPGEFSETTYTDSDGNYTFSDLPDGSYEVTVVPPTDHVPTHDADNGDDNTVEITIDGGEITETGNTWCPSGTDCSMDVNFGLIPNYTNSIAGVICLDTDQDGICTTGGETFPAGTSISIFDENGTFFGQMNVGDDGAYSFDNLPNANMVLSVSKVTAPLNLSTITTSLGDTPAYDIEDSEDNSLQYVAVSGDMTDVDFGYVFTQSFDLGDLPPPYVSEVTATSTGPAHLLDAVPSVYLGTLVDSEEFPTIRDDAEGDERTGLNDEDGVVFSDPATWTVGANGATMDVDVVGDGYLVGFADFNQDGDFEDAGEMIISQSITAGSHSFGVDIPAGTDLSGGQAVYVRIRLFETTPISPATASTGVTKGGEVEDYLITICKNLDSPGAIVGEEIGCEGYDPSEISASHAPSGGGGALEYQWQISEDNGLTWIDILNENGETYDPGYIIQSTRFRRGARRERCQDYVYSNVIVKSVVTNYDDPGAIVGNEDNCGIYDPDIITSVIAPSGGVGTSTPEYQWQYRVDGDPTWYDIANAEDEYFDPGVISATTEYRRGARKSPCTPFSYSNSITKMVSVNYVSPGTINGDQSICGPYDPTEITSHALPSGGVDGYEQIRWEMSTDDGATWSTISGANSETYDPGVITVTTMYRRIARRVPCTIWVNSNVVTKTVKPFPVATIINYPVSSGYLCELSSYEFEAEDAGTGATYAWDLSGFGVPTTADGQGPHFAEFDVPNNDIATNANVVLTTELDGCISTDNRLFTFRPEIVVDSVSTIDPAACSVKDGEITVNASYPSGAGVEYSVDGGLTWDSDPNFDNLGAGVYDVRVRYLGNECEERFGAVALSDPPPQADILVSSSEECTGQTIVVEAVATVGAPVFTWTFGNGAVPNTASGAGPHSVYFTQGGFANIAVTLDEAGCIGVRDTNIAIVANYTDGGSVIGGETLCSTFDPAEITAGSNPSGGTGGSLVYQWEFRESDGAGGWSAWQDVVGAVSPNLDPGLISATTQFRRKARRAPCSDWMVSNAVTATLVTKPDLADDTYNTVCPGFPHADNVSDNDFDLVNPSYSLLVYPTNGALDFEADGEFIYDPNSTFCGTDEFYYLVCNDGTGCCDTAHVIVDLTDTTPPSIVNVPDNITLSCDDQVPVADAVDITENCQSVSLNLDEYTTQGIEGCEFYNYDWVRIWNGVDYCSNSTEAQQVITIEDRTSPDIYRIYTLPNGKKMVAGVMENVSNHWKTVSLPIQFTTQPIILTQPVSKNETTPVIARLRNVSTTQFQLILQEEEGADGVHTQEDVAWIAFERGTFMGDDAFEVTSHLITDAVENFAFAEAFDNTPNVFATIQTNNESDPATVRLSGVDAMGVNAWLQEETSSDPEITHNLETVGLFAFQNTGDFKTIDEEVIGEIGTVTVSSTAASITFNNTYHNPVVIISMMPNGEHDPVTARVNNVTSTGCEISLDEWEYLDGTHTAEAISYIVIEGSLPLDQTVDCNNIPDAMTIGTEVIAVDNCDATIELIMVESDYEFDCSANTSFTRTWTTIDDCGNTTELVQTYYLKDDEAPTFTAPATIIIACNADKDDLVLTGDVEDENDNCTDDVEAVYTDNLSNVTGCGGYIIRTWTATDDCGNIATGIQYIHIAPENDFDRDNVPDQFDLDDDNDGIPDVAEGTDDFDGDGIPNYLDLDSDNDGISDLVEINGQDADGNGVVDNFGDDNWDYDGDGFAYGFDGNDVDTTVVSSATFIKTSLTNDRDSDNIPNFLDRDSDNDGISDLVEAGGVDVNGDGTIDYPTLGDPTSMVDVDGDGMSDTFDADDDGIYGSEDLKDPLIVFNGSEYKGGDGLYNPDFDGDMVPDFLDSDSDNDGIADVIEGGGIDTDGDGKIEVNGTFIDDNNDGFKDIYVNYPLVATQEDGDNEDGRPSDTDANGTVYTIGDLDMDGEPNHRDRDSDGDNINDIFETGLFLNDGDADGVLDSYSDTNMNGFDDIIESSANILTEADGFTTDGKPEDSGDADESAYLGAAADGEFAMANGTPDIDDDGDSVPNFLDSDSDNDLLPDDKEDKNADGKQSPRETGAYNPDSDDDEIKDGIEDWNRNGAYDLTETDPLNPNTDGDPLLDGEEDVNFNGIVDPIESDPRDPCDPMLNDACRGLVLDVKVKLMGAVIDGDTTNLMRDNMRDLQFIPEFEPYSVLDHIKHVGEDVFVEIPDSLLDVGYDPTVIGGAPGYGNGVINNTTTYDPTTGNGYGYGFGMTNGWNGHREWCNPGMFYTTGADAPVDWVLIEIRSALQPDSIVATRAGLLQRDGDVRDIDGHSYITFGNIPSGSFYVSVRHRNHLGVMTATPLILSPDVTTIDFTDPNTPVYGDNAMQNWNDEMIMWPGDLNGDERVIYQGPGNDVLQLFQEVILSEENQDVLANYILPGYRTSDFNLDGNSIYQGPSNEKAMILIYSIVGSSDNSTGLANFVLLQKLP